MRLHRILVSAIERNGGSVYEGMQVVGAQAGLAKVISVSSEAGVRDGYTPPGIFSWQAAGCMGGGLKTSYDGSVVETVFNLPIIATSAAHANGSNGNSSPRVGTPSSKQALR